MNAGNTGRDEQLGETTFTRGRTKRHAIKKNLRSRRTQKDAAATAVVQRRAEFFPGCLKLGCRAHVSELIQTCEFQQDVQAADKRPRPPTSFRAHTFRRGVRPPPMCSTTLSSPASRNKHSEVHCTHLNNTLGWQFGHKTSRAREYVPFSTHRGCPWLPKTVQCTWNRNVGLQVPRLACVNYRTKNRAIRT